MPHREDVEELIMVTHAVTKAVEELNLDELAQLLDKRGELISRLDGMLDEVDRRALIQAQAKAYEAIALQKFEAARQINEMFQQQRQRRAYGKSNAA